MEAVRSNRRIESIDFIFIMVISIIFLFMKLLHKLFYAYNKQLLHLLVHKKMNSEC